MTTYHIGLIKGTGKAYWNNGHRRDTVILQARQNKDLLDCELWQYLGYKDTTKSKLIAKKNELLAYINRANNTQFIRLIIE